MASARGAGRDLYLQGRRNYPSRWGIVTVKCRKKIRIEMGRERRKGEMEGGRRKAEERKGKGEEGRAGGEEGDEREQRRQERGVEEWGKRREGGRGGEYGGPEEMKT